MAVEAMRQGAYHYVNKPFNLDEIVLLVEKALETTRAAPRGPRAARAPGAALQPGSHRRGRATRWSTCARCSRRSRRVPASTVLLTGESGTGKDLAAKVIHYTSDRANKPFMNITCSALPESAARERAVRPRARRVHWCRSPEARTVRNGGRRDGLSRRNRRDGAGAAGEAAAVPRGEDVQAGRRRGGHPRRRPRDRRDEPQAGRGSASRAGFARICTTG